MHCVCWTSSIDFCSVVPEVVKVQVSNLCVNDKFLLSVMIMKDLRPTLVNMSVGLFHWAVNQSPKLACSTFVNLHVVSMSFWTFFDARTTEARIAACLLCWIGWQRNVCLTLVIWLTASEVYAVGKQLANDTIGQLYSVVSTLPACHCLHWVSARPSVVVSWCAA